MKKIIVLIIIAIVIAGGLGYLFYQTKTEVEDIKKVTLDPKNCTYVIDGKNITLKNGYSEEEIVSGSASKLVTQYFGNEASGDFNKDGLSDIAFILTQNSGGNGTFYYVAVALGTTEGCNGTNSILLGDRIAPQTMQVEGEKIIVNYADRKTSEAMTTLPSIGITKQLALDGITLNNITSEETRKEQACIISEGTVQTSLCCAPESDFPNLCVIGACGCSPTNSRQVKVCDCGDGKCFDGNGCVVTR